MSEAGRTRLMTDDEIQIGHATWADAAAHYGRLTLVAMRFGEDLTTYWYARYAATAALRALESGR